MSPTPRNPILDEIDQAHAQLSPEAQQAIELANPKPNLALSPAAAPADTTTAPAPLASPHVRIGFGGAGTADDGTGAPAPLAARPGIRVAPLGAPAPTSTPDQAAHLGELNRLTAPPARDASGGLVHDKTNTGVAGVDQIHNPLVRGLAKVGDVFSSLYPGIGQNIPGTTAHHEKLVRESQGIVKGDTEQENAASKRQLEAGQAHQAEANAAALDEEGKHRNVPLKAGEGLYDVESHSWTVEPTKNGTDTIEIEPDKAKALGIKPLSDGRYVLPKEAIAPFLTIQKPVEPKEGELPLGERVPSLNAAMLNRFKVLNPKATALPAEYTLPANATQKDFDRVDKLLEANERAVSSKAQQEQAAEARRQTQALAQANRQEKTDTALRKTVHDTYKPTLESGERFNVMAKNYEDAVKNHDQQAMLSLLANHLGMTMGLQKGARLTKDIIHEAERSRPWLQGMAAKFDKDGYLSGVTLAPEQMRQMVSLGRERFAEDFSKNRNEAQYLGATDEGPKRTPNRSTIRFYTGLANGDATKAKQLAAQDGWSVE